MSVRAASAAARRRAASSRSASMLARPVRRSGQAGRQLGVAGLLVTDLGGRVGRDAGAPASAAPRTSLPSAWCGAPPAPAGGPGCAAATAPPPRDPRRAGGRAPFPPDAVRCCASGRGRGRCPAASSKRERRSSARSESSRSIIFASMTTPASPPRPVPRSRSWMSRSRTGARFSRYSLCPERESRRVICDFLIRDRQGAVGVVEVERDLGDVHRPPPRRPLEDDVLHLAAAQQPGGLLAQHPAHGVAHVRLAAAVRPDDGRHPFLEGEGHGVGKRLEAGQFELGELHGCGSWCGYGW